MYVVLKRNTNTYLLIKLVMRANWRQVAKAAGGAAYSRACVCRNCDVWRIARRTAVAARQRLMRRAAGAPRQLAPTCSSGARGCAVRRGAAEGGDHDRFGGCRHIELAEKERRSSAEGKRRLALGDRGIPRVRRTDVARGERVPMKADRAAGTAYREAHGQIALGFCAGLAEPEQAARGNGLERDGIAEDALAARNDDMPRSAECDAAAGSRHDVGLVFLQRDRDG